MSADRFEADLRDALRDEAAAAPVVLTLAAVRARAGSRPRGIWTWTGRLALGVAIAGIAAVAIVVSTVPGRPLPGVGSSASAAVSGSIGPSTPASTPGPSATATPATSPLVVSYGPYGMPLVMALGGDQLEIMGAYRTGAFTPIAIVSSLGSVLQGWQPVDACCGDLHGAISSTRVLALSVTRGNQDGLERGVAVIDLGRERLLTVLPDAAAFAFLPDQTLVTVEGVTVNRLLGPYDGTPIVTTLPERARVVSFPAALSIAADGSGLLVATRTEGPNGTAVTDIETIAWDGSVTAADPAADPLLVTGADRAYGKDGQTAFQWADDAGPGGTSSAGLAVEGPNTPRTETGVADSSDYAWEPGGRRLIILRPGSVWAFDGRRTAKIAVLPEGEPPWGIVGFTPESVLLGTPNGGTLSVRLDGSAQDGLGGILIGIAH